MDVAVALSHCHSPIRLALKGLRGVLHNTIYFLLTVVWLNFLTFRLQSPRSRLAVEIRFLLLVPVLPLVLLFVTTDSLIFIR